MTTKDPRGTLDVTEAVEVVATTYGIDASELHETIMARRAVRALCAAVDLAVLRGHLDARSLIADARLNLGDPDAPGDEPELLRRLAPSRPAREREGIEARHGRDESR